MNQTFTTKLGYCHVTDKELLITRNTSPVEEDNPKYNFAVFFLGGLALLSFYFCLSFLYNWLTETPEMVAGKPKMSSAIISAMYGIAALVLIFNLVLNRNKTADYSIPLNDIEALEFKEATSITKAFFIVKYRRKGKLKNRLIGMKEGQNSDLKNLANAKRILSTIIDIS
ncbi:MAG: hypothetical protein ACI8Q1_001225 [Parvicella sp.]|jgi:hypothetical protein